MRLVRRDVLEARVSVVPAAAGELRLPRSEQARLFEAVAPGVPVLVMVGAGSRVEKAGGAGATGFQLVAQPSHPRDVLAKAEPPAKLAPSRQRAVVRVEAVCGRIRRP